MAWIKNPKDFWSGVLFIVFGVVGVAVSSGYSMGSAARMGPGYFPRALGTLLIILGTVVLVRGLRTEGEPVPAFYFRPLLFVLGAVVVFGLAVPYTGVLIGTLALIFVTSYASHEFRWKSALVSGTVLAVAAVLIFIDGLGVQLPIWPWPWNQ